MSEGAFIEGILRCLTRRRHSLSYGVDPSRVKGSRDSAYDEEIQTDDQSDKSTQSARELDLLDAERGSGDLQQILVRIGREKIRQMGRNQAEGAFERPHPDKNRQQPNDRATPFVECLEPGS